MTTDSLDPSAKSKVAVSLQSSFLGFFAHAGFINALLETGVHPAKISGSSAGALAASAYASGLKNDQLREFVMARELQRSFREWSAFFRATAVFGLYYGHGMVAGKKAVNYLRETLPVRNIEDAPLAELSIAVTNVTRQEGQIISKGEIAPYVIASCAAAPVIRSQEISGEHFLDGGFTNESPFEQWLDDPEIDTIIVHRIRCKPERVPKWGKRNNFISCWGAMHQVMADSLLKYRLAAAESAGKKIIIHQTQAQRAGLIASRKLAQANYDAGLTQWQGSTAHLQL